MSSLEPKTRRVRSHPLGCRPLKCRRAGKECESSFTDSATEMMTEKSEPERARSLVDGPDLHNACLAGASTPSSQPDTPGLQSTKSESIADRIPQHQDDRFNRMYQAMRTIFGWNAGSIPSSPVLFSSARLD